MSGQCLETLWYGKLPGAADYVVAGLRAAELACWESLLDSLMGQVHGQIDNKAAYLDAPALGFHLRTVGMTGLLLPSVDRVGRLFPLMWAVRLGTDGVDVHQLWKRAYGLCTAAIGQQWSCRLFEQQNRQLSSQNWTGSPQNPSGWWRLDDQGESVQALEDLGLDWPPARVLLHAWLGAHA